MYRHCSVVWVVLCFCFFMGPHDSVYAKSKKTTISKTCPSVLNFEVETIEGKKESLCEYAGDVVLVVNTATRGSLARQFRALQSLYEKYKDQGFTVLAFPSNDFGDLEEGTNKEIQRRLQLDYGVSFPVFTKGPVKMGGDSVFFNNLIKASQSKPRYAFHKYLINRTGSQVKSYTSLIQPKEERIIKQLELFLKQ